MTPRRLAGLAGVALAAAWLVAPASVPLYDGVGFPDEPYRYVAAPPGATATPAVTTATYRVSATGSTFPETIFFYSGESGPQVSILLRSTLAAPPGTRGIVFTAAPVAPDGPVPGAEVVGNVYRFTAEADPARGRVTMTPRPDATGKLILRATTARLGPVVHFREGPGAPWRALETDRAGQDTWGTSPVGFGDYVLAYPPGAGLGQEEEGGGSSYAVLTLSLLALVLGVILVSVRLARRRRS